MIDFTGCTIDIVENGRMLIARFTWTWDCALYLKNKLTTHGHLNGLTIRDGYDSGSITTALQWLHERGALPA